MGVITGPLYLRSLIISYKIIPFGPRYVGPRKNNIGATGLKWAATGWKTKGPIYTGDDVI